MKINKPKFWDKKGPQFNFYIIDASIVNYHH